MRHDQLNFPCKCQRCADSGHPCDRQAGAYGGVCWTCAGHQRAAKPKGGK